jgi:Na+-transporting methylmalonyl-CoA/oxaloacetate decarboxylase gamma subunit
MSFNLFGLSLNVLIGWGFGLIALIVVFVLILGVYGGGKKKPKLSTEEKALEKKRKKEAPSRKENKRNKSLIVKGEKFNKAQQVENIFNPRPVSETQQPNGVFNPSLKTNTFTPPILSPSPSADRTPSTNEVPVIETPPQHREVKPVAPSIQQPTLIRPPLLTPPLKLETPLIVSSSIPNSELLQQLVDEEAGEDDFLTTLRTSTKDDE